MPDISSTATLVLGFSALNFVLGFILGHYGLATIKNDITTIKDMISGQKANTTSAAPIEAPVVTTPAQPTQAGMV